ncbi:hypothetical protein HDU91_001956, partial [Kappamyces sp. JEL0680]
GRCQRQAKGSQTKDSVFYHGQATQGLGLETQHLGFPGSVHPHQGLETSDCRQTSVWSGLGRTAVENRREEVLWRRSKAGCSRQPIVGSSRLQQKIQAEHCRIAQGSGQNRARFGAKRAVGEEIPRSAGNPPKDAGK